MTPGDLPIAVPAHAADTIRAEIRALELALYRMQRELSDVLRLALQPTTHSDPPAQRPAVPAEQIAPQDIPAADAGPAGDVRADSDVSQLAPAGLSPPASFSPEDRPLPETPSYRGWCTPERAYVLKAAYAAGTPISVIRQKLEAIEGPTLPPNSNISAYAISILGVRRPKAAGEPYRTAATLTNPAADRMRPVTPLPGWNNN
jgi:hypothetical protein